MEKLENQTALQQAFSELEKMHPGLFNIYSEEGRNFINHFHKFLEIEKEQIIMAYKFGLCDEFVIGSENYYNETYNK